MTGVKRGSRRLCGRSAGALLIAFLIAPALAAEERESRSDPEGTPDVASAQSSDEAAPGDAEAGPRKTRPPLPLYVPPSRGRADTRSSGGTRAPVELPTLELVAPRHDGLTTRPDPTLYFFVSTISGMQIDFTLIADEAEEPLVETTLDTPAAPGFQAVSLADLGVELAPATHYMWFVSVVADSESRSGDLVSGAGILRVESSEALVGALAEADADFAAYARHGIWYDAIGDLADALARDPDDTGLRAQHAALLEQGELPEAAAWAAR